MKVGTFIYLGSWYFVYLEGGAFTVEDTYGDLVTDEEILDYAERVVGYGI